MRPPSRTATLLACASALVGGGFVSLFTAGPALFADGPFGQRPIVLGFSALAFALLGLTIGFVIPGAWKPAAVCLACSALPVVLFFGRDTASQLPMALLSVGFMLGDSAAGAFGVWGGARMRMLRSASRPAGESATPTGPGD